MEFLVESTTKLDARRRRRRRRCCSRVNRATMVDPTVLPLVPPTKRATAPAIAYKMLRIRRLRTPLPIAAFYRSCCCCCCCCCTRLGGRVMSANSGGPASLSQLLYAPAGLPVSASHRCRRSTTTVPCYCIRAQRQTSKRLIRDEMRDVTGTETMRWRSILCWQRGVQSPRGSSSLECTLRLRIRDYRL